MDSTQSIVSTVQYDAQLAELQSANQKLMEQYALITNVYNEALEDNIALTAVIEEGRKVKAAHTNRLDEAIQVSDKQIAQLKAENASLKSKMKEKDALHAAESKQKDQLIAAQKKQIDQLQKKREIAQSFFEKIRTVANAPDIAENTTKKVDAKDLQRAPLTPTTKRMVIEGAYAHAKVCDAVISAVDNFQKDRK